MQRLRRFIFGKKINKSDIEYSRVDESAKEDGSSLISTKFLEKLAEKVNEKSYNKDFKIKLLSLQLFVLIQKYLNLHQMKKNIGNDK